MVPRSIFNDFRDNFGNFSACFAVQTQSDGGVSGEIDRFGNTLEETKGGSEANNMWPGSI